MFDGRSGLQEAALCFFDTARPSHSSRAELWPHLLGSKAHLLAPRPSLPFRVVQTDHIRVRLVPVNPMSGLLAHP
jgi:hypothetical protein